MKQFRVVVHYSLPADSSSLPWRKWATLAHADDEGSARDIAKVTFLTSVKGAVGKEDAVVEDVQVLPEPSDV